MSTRRTPALRRAIVSVDVVLLSARDEGLAVLIPKGGGGPRARAVLPWGAPAAGERLDAAAERIARATGQRPSWLAQIGAFDDRHRHPGGVEISIAFVGLAPSGAGLEDDAGAWFSVDAPPALPGRHRALVASAVTTLRARMDRVPIAFHLLSAAFTLSELQRVYEILLERPLHKASFRRALEAAALVEPLDEWRSEGRGRPAQLFRYSPRLRPSAGRGVRFDLLEAD